MSESREPIFSFRVDGLLNVSEEDLTHDFADHMNVINGLAGRPYLAGTFRFPDFVGFYHPENGEEADPAVFRDDQFLASGPYGCLRFHTGLQHVYELDFSRAAALAFLVLVENYYPQVSVTVTHCVDGEVLSGIYSVVRQVNSKVAKPDWMKDIEQDILFKIERPEGLDFRG